VLKAEKISVAVSGDIVAVRHAVRRQAMKISLSLVGGGEVNRKGFVVDDGPGISPPCRDAQSHRNIGRLQLL
jgi:hypothetical protein